MELGQESRKRLCRRQQTEITEDTAASCTIRIDAPADMLDRAVAGITAALNFEYFGQFTINIPGDGAAWASVPVTRSAPLFSASFGSVRFSRIGTVSRPDIGLSNLLGTDRRVDEPLLFWEPQEFVLWRKRIAGSQRMNHPSTQCFHVTTLCYGNSLILHFSAFLSAQKTGAGRRTDGYQKF